MTDSEESHSSLPAIDHDPIPVRRRRLDSVAPPGTQDVIIVDSPLDLSETRARRRRRRRPQPQNAIVDLTCDPIPVVDLVDLTSPLERTSPIHIENTPPPPLQSNHSSTPASVNSIPARESQVKTSSSRDLLSLSCPVCLEPLYDLLKRKVEIRSTICGHVFCRDCITLAIQSNKKCPTCRRKLSPKQHHPLYLPLV